MPFIRRSNHLFIYACLIVVYSLRYYHNVLIFILYLICHYSNYIRLSNLASIHLPIFIPFSPVFYHSHSPTLSHFPYHSFTLSLFLSFQLIYSLHYLSLVLFPLIISRFPSPLFSLAHPRTFFSSLI